MDYQQVICQHTGKIMSADKIYKIRNNKNCIENVVSVCNNCPYIHSDNPCCNNCYGTVVQNATRKINAKTKRASTTAVTYRNNFCKVGDEYVQMMDADDFLDTIEIICNLSNANWNSGQQISGNIRAYDRGSTWRTDCYNCKNRCHKNGELTACEKAKEYAESVGVNPATASEAQLAKLELPEECICKEQVQRCYMV